MSNKTTSFKLIAINDSAQFHPATAKSPPSTLIIAEIGVNHDGNINKAIKLIHAASSAGANAVKFQYFHPDRLLSNQARLAKYQQENASDPYQLLDNLKLTLQELTQARIAAKKSNLLFIVTPFSPDDISELAKLDIDAVKIASPDAVNTPLLNRAAYLNKPLIISTGTTELSELTPAAILIKQHQHSGCLMQCVSSYPTPPEQAALSAIPALADKFNLPVGYSDHTPTLDTGPIAVATGAVAIEKHLTLDQSSTGPDHAASITPDKFTEYVNAIRMIEIILGPKSKSPLNIELDVKDASRQSICITKNLPASHTLTPSDLTIKRPGSGIPAPKLSDTLGRTLQKPVNAGDLLRISDLKN